MNSNPTTTMHPTAIIAKSASLLAIPACGLVSCASFEHPLTRHDMDGDGAISHSEYQQHNMQYNLASRQRADEYSRARLLTEHAANANGFVYQANRLVNQARYFGH
ncbi:MAG: hypothetical protein NTW21_36430 [Verrucomicrobia bacterium]|nr:hypothetical protein [Verrucomicrobiota bacterium]